MKVRDIIKRGTVVVSGHPSADPPAGTQANIWKQAGLPKP